MGRLLLPLVVLAPSVSVIVKLTVRTYIFVSECGDNRWRQNAGNCCHDIAEAHQFSCTYDQKTPQFSSIK